jgi:hypothetical protein
MTLAKENHRIYVGWGLDFGRGEYEGLPMTSWFANASIRSRLDDQPAGE